MVNDFISVFGCRCGIRKDAVFYPVWRSLDTLVFAFLAGISCLGRRKCLLSNYCYYYYFFPLFCLSLSLGSFVLIIFWAATTTTFIVKGFLNYYYFIIGFGYRRL